MIAEYGGQNFWWVNHKKTFKLETTGGYIWSPKAKKNGVRNESYENMKRVQPGDLIFSFADTRIQAVGVCTAPAIIASKPVDHDAASADWGQEGWKVAVAFEMLPTPFRPKDYMALLEPTLPSKYSPIKPSGDGNQNAYLSPVPDNMAEVLITLIGPTWRELNLKKPMDWASFDAAVEEAEKTAERLISNRTDIGETTTLQLVQARRGQGVFRSNLEQFETQCRLTGVKNAQHLRASHIKPWRVSNNYEKLDGNNGLLLSPHVDHLFDRGYISFSDEGGVMISPRCDESILESWQINRSTVRGTFRKEQLPYLEYHREFVFKK